MFHQIQYRKMPGVKVESWTGNFSESDRQLLSEVSRVWADISPTVNSYTAGLSSDAKVEETTFTIEPGQETLFFEKGTGGRIVGFEIDGGTAFEGLYKDVILSATWDNEAVEAIHAPLADYFGYAFGSPAMRSIVMGRQGTTNYSYLPLPYDQSATMKLIYEKREGVQQTPISVTARVHYNDNAREATNEGSCIPSGEEKNLKLASSTRS